MTVERIDAGPLASRCYHVALEVSDMDRSIEFYRGYLGMRLTERYAGSRNEKV